MRRLVCVAGFLVASLLGCGSPTPTPDAVATEAVIAHKIFATLTASAPRVAITPPSATVKPTDTPLSPDLATFTVTPVAVTVRGANLRAGPGTSYAKVGSLPQGQPVQVVARNAAGDWLQLADGSWIFAELVANAPNVSVAQLSPTEAAPATGTLTVTFIDVGQGDSILIQTADGHAALIDGGNPGSGVLAKLRQAGVQKLDLVVVSHPHSDHIGGLPEVIKGIPVAQVVASGQPHTTPDYERLLDAIAGAKAQYTEVKRGDKLALGGIAFDVLSPERTQPTGDLNHNSVVLRLTYGRSVFQFEGDADAAAESSMRAAGLLGIVTVLKVGHHGSRTASSPAFLAAVQPVIAVYSAGAGNDYGHPHQQTIQALQAVGAQIYGTDRNGSVTVTSDGSTYRVSTEKGGPMQKVAATAVPIPSRANPMPVPTVVTTPVPARTDCDRAYPDVCIPSPPPDLDCPEIPYRNFRVLPPDPHRFDGDHDGIGCES